MTESSSLRTLPLFPLNTVLFPGGMLPLQIFEIRYLDLIARCQRDGTPFGVVKLNSGSEVRQPGQIELFERVGTLASIETITHSRPGLMAVRCKGAQRFRVLSQTQQRFGLWSAEIDHVPSDPVVAIPEHLMYVATALDRLRGTMREEERTCYPHGLTDPVWSDSGWVANRWAELLPVAPAIKQNLMALENPLLRLELIGDLLQQHDVIPAPGDAA